MSNMIVTHHLQVTPKLLTSEWDRLFFSGMIGLLWIIVFFGFAKTYYQAGLIKAPLPNKLIHIHGAVFTAWMLLLVLQETLIASKKVKRHMQLGMAGFALALAMVILGVMAATDQMRRASGPPEMDPRTFYVIPISVIFTFALLVFAALKMRFQATAHKRLILIATIAISTAAVDRLPIAFVQSSVILPSLMIAGLLLLVCMYDWLTLHTIHRSTALASGWMVMMMFCRLPVGRSHLWHFLAGEISSLQ